MNHRGRPLGWRKEVSEVRPTRTLRAFDDEWTIIKKFAHEVKFGDKEKCKLIVEVMNQLDS